MSLATALFLFSIFCHVYSTNTGDQISGNTCCSSPAGIPGIPGTHGNQGPKGDNGPKGEIGLAGEKGEQGDIGRDGAPGKSGPSGPKGDAGLKGEKGTKGSLGPVGPQGVAGGKGSQGEPGTVHNKTFKSAFSFKLGGTGFRELPRGPIKYDTVITNTGGDYNPTTGKFVCSVSGDYVFSFTAHHYGSDGTIAITIKKNNVVIVSSYTYDTSSPDGMNSISSMVVLNLVVDDEVWTEPYNSSTDKLNIYHYATASFSGFLLYPAT